MIKELLAIDQELKEILEAGNKKIAEYEAEIQVAKDSEEQANRAVIEAKMGDDPKLYSQAIEEKRTAENIADYYKGRIEQVKAKPLITQEQYTDYTKQITEAMDKINKDGNTRAKELLQELEAIKDDLKPSYNKANELLGQLQNNLYKADYNKVMSQAREQGTPINSSMLKNEYKDNSLVIGIDNILKSHTTQKIIEGGSK